MRETLVTALREAGKILRTYQGRTTSTVKEGHHSIVTEADLAAELRIVALIKQRFPDHGIIGEEQGYVRGKEYAWIIDPLDGTSNYAVGLPWYGVLIAVLKDHEPVLAGAYLPHDDLLYIAEKGKGATCNGERVHVSGASSLNDVLFSYCMDPREPAQIAKETALIARIVPHVRNMRATNSAPDSCYVADGRIGGMINQTTKIWDIAAPLLIIEEAGGVVTDIEGNAVSFAVDAQSYGKNFTIVAANPVLHAKILGIIRDPS